MAAAAVVDRIEQSARLLGENPGMGHVTEIEKVRCWIVTPYPYLIYYTVLGRQGEVRILRVRHTARRRLS